MVNGQDNILAVFVHGRKINKIERISNNKEEEMAAVNEKKWDYSN